MPLIAIICATAMMLGSCHDDTFDDMWIDSYPEGMSQVKVELDYQPMSSQNIDASSGIESRSLGGKTMSKLDDLCLVAYDMEGNLMPGFPVNITKADHGLEVTDKPRYDADASNGNKAEDVTSHATFNLKLPNGQYYLYALSNVGSRNTDGSLAISSYDAMTEEGSPLNTAMQTRRGLLAWQTRWDTENPYNNFEMLGYFTSKSESSSPSTGSSTNDVTVSIRETGTKIHCWLRRCVAKVTIDFDGSGLRDNIYIYIKRATIHDIPAACSLGDPNRPSDRDKDIISFKDSKYMNGDDYLSYEPKGGDVITYSNDADWKNWPRVAKGSPELQIKEGAKLENLHAEDAPSLFLYENMQGNSYEERDPEETKLQKPGENQLVVGAGEEKDLMECGSYIEVEGYYEMTSKSEVSQGRIIYRFMLGKDALKNFDVERNHHIKITMCPRGNGNDVDWHIEYNKESGFEIHDPYYVSYLYNHVSSIHFKYSDRLGRNVTKVEAEIVGNNWWPDGAENGGPNSSAVMPGAVEQQDPLWYKGETQDKMGNIRKGDTTIDEHKDWHNASFTRNIYTDQYPDLKGKRRYIGNGFLSLRAIKDKNNITFDDLGVSSDKWSEKEENTSMNDRYFYGISQGGGEKNNRSKRTYYCSGEVSENKDEAYTVTKESDGYRFNIPMFTRAKNLIKETAYSGNNMYESASRTAYIRLIAYNGDVKLDSIVIQVKQVPRITNPKGIYRSVDNNSNFAVELVQRENVTSPNYIPFTSDGPWMAEVLGDENFINLNGRQVIQGGTNSYVKFNVRFNKLGTMNPAKNRYAVIRVRYHDYMCTHLIFVRQGYDADDIGTGTEWDTRNLIYDGVMADDPRDEGSLFKLGNLKEAIDVKSNCYDWVDKQESTITESMFTPADQLWIAQIDKDGHPIEPTDTKKHMKSWTDIKGDAENKFAGSDVATVQDIYALYNSKMFPNIKNGFGILYADGATGVAMNLNDAVGYYRHDKSINAKSKGMRGLFVYSWDGIEKGGDRYNFRNMFFPIGRQGYGHRRSWDMKNATAGTLRYCLGRDAVRKYDEDTDKAIFHLPQFFDIYMRPGAIYWGRTFTKDDSMVDAGGEQQGANAMYKFIALDINYFSFDVSALKKGTLQKHSQWSGCEDVDHIDACFLRTVKKTRSDY